MSANGIFYRPRPVPTEQNITLVDAAHGGQSKEDPTAWITQGYVAWFLLMNAAEIKYLCMLAYTFFHGCKLFGSLKEEHSIPYKFVRMIFQCTGGGLLVPIFINAIPTVKSTPFLKAAMIVLYEAQRASVVVKLTSAAAKAIPATEFAFPLFGPIFCGAIAGCGGGFLPFTKGLGPIENGLAPNMFSALVAATGYHLFMNTSLSDDIPYAAKKAQVVIGCYFIVYSLVKELDLVKVFKGSSEPSSEESKSKKE
ncbi:expressed unknown protein [Seminavis robusta]|uniref:Uncharacterized protein n=1 Tax=Seminavis robusta TaxID=568900 RepID=A0A9N8DNU2_9STRA|nr:expressed unknown protein [Seminavis robusta]|eukprot:Sro249_g098660.1 n/a (253) ;mRNA; f:30572-31578